MLQCVAVFCSVMQCVAVNCSDLQFIAVCYNIFGLNFIAECDSEFPGDRRGCCGILQCVAVCCSVLPCVAGCCSAFHCAMLYLF